ncbi:hypothetical protein K474DRAFT_1651749 [Panus rudis PR-1116 ss-1]|nr:hypothetical protein K474DRAFT_1651749 [Panus rudis PR-1116 ss-1]
MADPMSLTTAPLDENLKGILKDLITHGVTSYDKIIRRLGDDHGIKIGRSKLAEYLRCAGLQVRKAKLSEGEQHQAVLDEMALDPLQRHGPRWHKESLLLKGVFISRDRIHRIMQQHAPDGFAQRHPRAKVQRINRVPLAAVGPDDEWSIDGHDKMLQAGFAIYGIRDKWGGRRLQFSVVPSNRYAKVIGVLYLRCVKKQKVGIPVQITSDHGSETGEVFAYQKALRYVCKINDDSRSARFAPELDERIVPSYRYTSSIRNITIERNWRPFFYEWAVNILHFYNEGRFECFISSSCNPIGQIANWIWFPLIQRELDSWCERQNNHYVRTQKDKILPSGGTPEQFYRYPEDYGGTPCLIPIPEDVINEVLAEAEAEAANLLEYMDQEYQGLGQKAYVKLGEPAITLHTAWSVFEAMIKIIEAM